MQVFGISDVGKKRELNEDNFSVWQNENILIAVVADGMGGARAGEVASSIACRRIMENLQSEIACIASRSCDRVQLMLDIDRAIDIACGNTNNEVFARSSSDDSLSGMGTTIVGCVILDNIIWAFNVGDSRLYHIGENGISQLTVDHSFVQALLDSGKITAEEARSHPNRNIILRAVGIEKNVECDIIHMDLESGFYLICSDGLSNYFEEEKFLRIINSSRSLSEKTEALVEWANVSGGADNITAVLIDTEITREDGK